MSGILNWLKKRYIEWRLVELDKNISINEATIKVMKDDLSQGRLSDKRISELKFLEGLTGNMRIDRGTKELELKRL